MSDWAYARIGAARQHQCGFIARAWPRLVRRAPCQSAVAGEGELATGRAFRSLEDHAADRFRESEVARAVDHDLSDRLLPLGVVARFIAHRGGQAVARARLGVTAAGIDEGTRRDATLGDERNLRILGARVGLGSRC